MCVHANKQDGFCLVIGFVYNRNFKNNTNLPFHEYDFNLNTLLIYADQLREMTGFNSPSYTLQERLPLTLVVSDFQEQ